MTERVYFKMFLDNLSANVLKLCDYHHLSYERASERCSLSSRYFGSIVRGKTAPGVLTLEKLCTGFNLTPNDLLITSAMQRSLPTGSLCLLHRSAAIVTLPA